MRRVLISCRQLQRHIDDYRSLFAQHDIEIELPVVEQQLLEADLLPIIDQFDGVIAGDDEFSAKVLEKGSPRLKTVARWGVGVDSVDLQCAKRLGITVSNTPNVFGEEVADVVMGYVILLARQLHLMDRAVRQGTWLKVQGVSLQGKTLGIIGMGSIGRALAARALSAGMQVIGYDVTPAAQNFSERAGYKSVDFDTLLQNADFITLNCNLTPSNRHLLNRRAFSLMKQGVYIINTARGPLIDEEALIEALAQKKVTGAALDVFENEPLSMTSPLRDFDNCIFGTHNSSNTYEAVARVNELAVQNLLDALQKAELGVGEPVRNQIN